MSLNISSEIRQLDLLSRNFRNSHLQTEERNLLKGCLSKQLGKIEILFNNFNNYKANRASCSDFYKHIKENIQLSKDKELIDKIQRIDHILNKHETTLNLPPFIQKALAEMGLKGSNTLQEHLVNELKNLLSRQETANEGHQLAELIITHRGSIEPENDSHLINQLFNVYFGENLTKNNDNRQSLMMLIHETPIEERDNLIQKILSTSDSLDQIFEITNNFPNEQKRAVLIFMLYFDISLVNQLHLDLTANPERITIEHILSYCFTNLDYLNSNPTFSREVFKEWIISSQFNHSKDLHAFKFKIKDWDENKKKSFLQGIDHAVFWLKDIQNPKTRREFLSSTPPNSYFAFGESLTNLILETHPSEQGQSITRIRTSINKTECLSQMIQIEHSASTEEKRSLLLYLFHINDPSIKKLYSLSKENRVTEALHSSLKNLPYLASNPILSKEIFKEWLISNLFDYDKALAGIEFSIKDWDENKKKSFLRGISLAIFWLKDIQDPSKRREFLSSTPPNSYFAFGEALTNLIGETPPSEQNQLTTGIRNFIKKTGCLSLMIHIENSALIEQKKTFLLFMFHSDDTFIKKLYSIPTEDRMTSSINFFLENSKNLELLVTNPILFKEWIISTKYNLKGQRHGHKKQVAIFLKEIKKLDENKKKLIPKNLDDIIDYIDSVEKTEKRRQLLYFLTSNNNLEFLELLEDIPALEFLQTSSQLRNETNESAKVLLAEVFSNGVIKRANTTIITLNQLLKAWIATRFFKNVENPANRQAIMSFLSNIPQENLLPLFKNVLSLETHPVSEELDTIAEDFTYFRKQLRPFGPEFKDLTDPEGAMLSKALDKIFENFSFQSHSTPFRLFILSTLLEMTKKNIVLTKGLEEIYSYLNLKISSLQENPSQSPSLIPLVETLIHFHKDFKMELPTENSYLRNLCDIIALNEISNQNQIRISKILQKLSIKDLPTFVLAVSTLNTSNDLESDKVALWEAIDHYGFDLSKEALSLLGNNVSLEAFISAIDSIQKIPPMNS